MSYEKFGYRKTQNLMLISNHLIEITKKVHVKKDVNEKEFFTFNTLFSVKDFLCELFAIVLTDSNLAPTSVFLLMHGVNSSKKILGLT
jgi:hypothetical protein